MILKEEASVTHLFEGVACDCLECLLHINGFFGAGLKVRDVVLTLTPGLSPFGGHLVSEINEQSLVRVFI